MHLSKQKFIFHLSERCAGVTGGNKGIGLEVCRQLASNGIVVTLTARDEKKGLEVIRKLKDSDIADDYVVFHQLDVVDADSVASLAEFVKTRFGKLDNLVNNAAIGRVVLHPDNLRRGFELCGGWPNGKQVSWNEMATQNLEMAKQCVQTNYYGAKAMVEALAPLLQLSHSPIIVYVSAKLGLLQNIPSEWVRSLLSDVEKLTEERVDEVANQFLKDFKDDLLGTRGWPVHMSAYIVAKACISPTPEF